MTILFSLVFLTSLIVWLQVKTWKVERNIIFPVFTGIFYYWSVAGAWLFSFDSLTSAGKEIGFQYYYLLKKMFPVSYDETYLQVIWMYSGFIICLQFFILFGLKWLKKQEKQTQSSDLISLKSKSFIIISVLTLILSFWIVKDVILYSLLLNESVYLNIRSAPIQGYTLHQYACWIMIVSLYFYLGLYLRKNQTYVKVEKPNFIFWFVFAICNLYLIIIGSRHETFFGGIAVLIIMSYPFRSIRNSKAIYSIVIGLLLLILILNDPIRSLMPVIASNCGLTDALHSPEREKEANLFQVERTIRLQILKSEEEEQTRENISQNEIVSEEIAGQDELSNDESLIVSKEAEPTHAKEVEEIVPSIAIEKSEIQDSESSAPIPSEEKVENAAEDIDSLSAVDKKRYTSLVYQNNSLLTKISFSVANIIFSNEMFAGHFSMYGVVKKKVQPKYGFSFKNLMYSFVPSFVVSERPMDSYTYYSQQMNFKGKQGFTINHITAWYLNASYFGLIIGPFFLSLLLLIPFYLSKKFKNPVYQLLSIIALCSITAFGAMLVRSGPEAFKAVLYESILIPIFIVFLAVLLRKINLMIKTRYRK